MKKSSEPFPSGKYNNGEVSRRLYRGAVDAARRLDDHLRNALQQDILGPDVTLLRMRLKDYCERLLFSDPLEYGRKAEELMWRKVYYDFFQFYKQQKKKFRIAQPDPDLQVCLLAGIGNYHHLILRLQAEFQLNLENKIDVPFVWQQRGIKKERWKKHRRSLEIEDSSKTWAEQMCHRFLICLGDLSRYLSDAGDPDSSILSKRYYYQAFFISPTSGMPLNQLGTLAGTKNYGCEALYYYMRCLMSQQPFDGVEGNLSLLFEKNNETFKEIDASEDVSKELDLSKRFTSRFLKLCEHFYYQKDENLQGLCQDVLKDFDLCLQNLLNKEKDSVSILDEEIFFKIIIVSLVCFARLQQQGSSVVSAAAAFTLSLLSHVVRHCLKSLSQKLLKESAAIEIKLPSPSANGEDEMGNSGTSGTVTPRTAVQTPINDSERLKELSQNQMNCSNVAKEEKKPRKKKVKKKVTRRTIAEHLRTARRRRNCSSTSQEDSEDVSEGELEKHSPLTDEAEDDKDDEIAEGTSDDEIGDINSDISETGSVYSSSDDLESEEEDTEMEEEVEAIAQVKETSSQEDKATLCNGNNNEVEDENDNVIPVNEDNQQKTATVMSLDDEGNEIQQKGIIQKEIQEIPEEVYNYISSETLLASIKVLSDWLKTNADIISACAESSKPLWTRFVDLLNLLIKSESKLLLVKEAESSHIKPLKRELLPNYKATSWMQNHFLLEDLELRQLPPLVKAHNQIQEHMEGVVKLSSYEQVYLRVQCLIHFGFVLSDCVNTGVNYDYDLGCFEFSLTNKSATNPNTPTRGINGINKNLRRKNWKANGNANYSPGSPICGDIENDRKQLMRNMAHLWLKSEVKDLEKEARRGPSANNLSPYLVPDTTALCHNLGALKQLESAKRFILILPSVVVANLDLLKKDSLGAREAIRWVETELRRGSRFLRAQKQHERLSLVPMKYPKKKDKEAWDFFQILECCNYLSQQSASGGRDPAVPMVTLVTGAAANHFLPTNSLAIATSSGVSMESVDEFVSKWRSSSKSQG